MEGLRKGLRKKVILLLLGVTKGICSTERSVPGKWCDVVDSIRVSSQTVHLKLIEVDSEAAMEFYELEEDFKRRIGKGKLYRREDLDLARKRVETAFVKR